MSDLVAARSPIELCHHDVLLMIFELIVEEERKGLSEQLLEHANVVPKTPSTLALVCRHWKNLIYDKGYFWAVVSIDARIFDPTHASYPTHALYNPQGIFEQAQKRAKMAKHAPVDLYVSNFFIYQDSTSIDTILGVATNIVKLHVESRIPTTPIWLTRRWSKMSELREAAYIFPLVYGPHVELSDHLRGMPNLTSLKIIDPRISLAHCTGSPLLPVLKVLRLEGAANLISYKVTPLAAFISHCPRLEELYLGYDSGFIMQYKRSIPPLTLACLHKLSMSNAVSIMVPFISGFIKTPVLENLSMPLCRISDEDDTQVLLTVNAPTLTTLSFCAPDTSNYRNSLLPLVQLTSLTLTILHGEGTFLTAFYAPVEDVSSTNQPMPKCLPSLRVLKLSLNRTSLSSEHFSRFATARCIPINTQGMTEAGYKALECLHIVQGGEVSCDISGAMRTAAWQAANISQKDRSSYELHWDNSLV